MKELVCCLYRSSHDLDGLWPMHWSNTILGSKHKRKNFGERTFPCAFATGLTARRE